MKLSLTIIQTMKDARELNAARVERIGSAVATDLRGASGVGNLIALGEIYAEVLGYRPTEPEPFKNYAAILSGYTAKKAVAGEKLADVPEVDQQIRALIGDAHPHASVERRKAYGQLVADVVDAAGDQLSALAAAGRENKTRGGAKKDGPHSLIAAKRKRTERLEQQAARDKLAKQLADYRAAVAQSGSNVLGQAGQDLEAANSAWSDYASLRRFASELGARDNLYSKSSKMIAWPLVAPFWARLPEAQQTRDRLVDWCSAALAGVMEVDADKRSPSKLATVAKGIFEPILAGDGTASAGKTRDKRERTHKEELSAILAGAEKMATKLRDMGEDAAANSLEDWVKATRPVEPKEGEAAPPAPTPPAPPAPAPTSEEPKAPRVARKLPQARPPKGAEPDADADIAPLA